MSESTSSGPALKRKRTAGGDIAGGSTTDAVTKSSIWFDDGNIVFQAENTQFRVHKGVLSRHSTVFGDMFTVPQPEDQPMINGCPIVYVTDSPEDWQNVFSVLYDSVKAYNWTHAVSLTLLGSMLRLGRKYQIDHLQEEAMKRLRAELPRTLDSWDETFTEVDGLFERKKRDYHIFDLVNLLSELGIESLLPIAYYACLESYTLTPILRGGLRADGTSVDLSINTKISLALGYEALSGTITDTLNWLGDDSFEGCPQQTCTDLQVENLRMVITYWHNVMLYSPMAWENIYLCPSTDFCQVCAKKIHEKCQASRRRVWEKLPTYFDLPKWDELKDL